MLISAYLFMAVLPFSLPCSLTDEHQMYVTCSQCVRQKKVIFRDNCLPACPKWVHYYYNDTHTCCTECPEDSVVNRSSCLSSTVCTSNNQVVFNRTCVDACPIGSPYTKDGICTSTCPKDNVINGSMCIEADKCTKMGNYIFNGTCVKSCPIEAPFIKYGTCLYNCTSDTVRNGTSSCITEEDCHKLKVTYNGDCLNSCPSKAPFKESGKCLSHCSKGLVMNGLDCITSNSCGNVEKKFAFNDNCVSACPKEAPYITEKNGRICDKKCTDRFLYIDNSFECISMSSCTSITEYYRFIYNGSCVQECPDDAKYMHGRSCYSKCPDGIFANGFECTSSCTSNRVIYNGTCVQECPVSAPLIYDDSECYSKCPDNLLANGSKCINNYECRSYHKFAFDGKCLESCPNEARFMKDGECYHQCPQGTVHDNILCIGTETCKGKEKLIYNGTCIEHCPPECPYVKDGKCVVSCQQKWNNDFHVSGKQLRISGHGENGNMIVINGTTCIGIKNCTEHGHFVYDQICVLICPPGTGTCKREVSPWNRICYSLERLKIFSRLSSGCCVLCLLVLVSMVYNPKGSKN